MIVEFSFQNFMSFPHEATFSMAASNTVKEMEDSNGYSNVVQLKDADLKLLKVGAVYGANASGKSNLISAISFFKLMVINSFLDENILKDSAKIKFLLSTEGQSSPASFEMIFIIKDTRYRYGFEIKDDAVQTEWLFKRSLDASRESYCFTRENGEIKINSKTFKGAGRLESKTRSNALFLSTSAQFNVETSMEIKDWFNTQLHILVAPEQPMQFTARQFMTDDWMKQRVLNFIRLIDLGIEDLNVSERTIDMNNDTEARLRQISIELARMINPDNKELKRLDISASHSVYNGDELVRKQSFPFELESLGTNKIFSLLGPWFDCLRDGGTLVVDEFGASLHTHLAMEMIRLFQSQMNSNGAQLIVTTHDTNLLRRDLLRRDQIWFVEKDRKGESDLYSLVEYKINQAQSVRNDASYQKDHLVGKYGAIPYFGNIEQFITDYSDDGVQE